MNDSRQAGSKRVLTVFVCIAVWGHLSAMEPSWGPTTMKNLSPLFYGLNPPWCETAETGNWWALTLTHASMFQLDSSRGWSMRLDMEMTELRLSLRKRIAKSLEIGVELPALGLHAGVFDGLIDTYHGIFNFNDYGRSLFPRDQFHFTLIHDNGPVVGPGNGYFGLGDIQVGVKQSIADGENHLALRLTCELPSGNAGRGSGNGSVDWGFAFLLESRHYKNLTLLVNLGMVLPGDIRGTQIIATKPYFMFALLTEFRLGRSLAIFGDFTVLTSPFTQINLPFFSHHPLLLNLGIKYTRGKSMFGFSFMEDLNLSNAPDIAIQLTYARRF